MKNTFILIAFICSAAIGSNIYGQQTPTPVSDDKDLRDTNVKSRSVDLERVDRDARKTAESPIKNDAAKTAVAAPEDKLAAKFDEIKTDYEQIQLSQDAVIKAYQGTGKIDYAQIGKSALEINKSAARLNANLFPAVETPDAEKEENKDAEKKKETKSPKSVRDLIVDLDNAVGRFATSPMFQNLRTPDATASVRAKSDLEKIIELSAFLEAEARKAEAKGN